MPNNPDFARVEQKGPYFHLIAGDEIVRTETVEIKILYRERDLLNRAFRQELSKRVGEAFEEAAKVADEVAEQKKNGNHEMSYSVGYAMARRIAEAIRSRKGKGG